MKRDTEKLKQKLIATGVAEIEKKGINQLSIRTVAQKCGVSHGAPYRHFGSKEGYLQVLLAEISERLAQALKVNITQEDSAHQQLQVMGANFFNFAQDYPNFFEILLIKYPLGYLETRQNQIDFDCELPGFQTFKAMVQNLKAQENLDLPESELIIHLWSYIAGLAILGQSQGGETIDSSTIKSNIANMLDIYIKGAKA